VAKLAESERALARNESAADGADPRVVSDGHFAVQLNHFIPVFLAYPVAVFPK
jgi:hypothetical protein